MSNRIATLAVIVAAVVPSVYPFGSGAPNRACVSMTPAHPGQNFQTTAPPYAIRVGKTSYTSGDRIPVTIYAACNSETFQGFMIQARRVNMSDQTPVGFFQFPGANSQQVAGCGQFNQAVTHTDTVIKTELTVDWLAPSPPQGDVSITVTFLKNYGTFWVKVLSDIIQDASTPIRTSTGGVAYPTRTVCQPPAPVTAPPQPQPVRTTTTTTTTSPPVRNLTPGPIQPTRPPTRSFTGSPDSDATTEFMLYPYGNKTISSTTAATTVQTQPAACGVSKGCYSWCEAGRCRFNVTTTYTSDDLHIEMSAIVSPTENWIAVAFSRDATMGDDSVVECVQDGSRVNVYTSYNPGYNNVRIGKLGISRELGSVTNGVFQCSFLRKLSVPSEARIFDLRNSSRWYLFLASGSTQGGRLTQHSITPHVSEDRVDLRDTGIVIEDGPSTSNRLMVIRAHGSLMVVAWIFTTSLGIIVARYYKLLGGNTTCCNDRYSFHIHRACMTLTLVCVSVSTVLIFVKVGGLSKIQSDGTLLLQAHPILGIIVTSLVLVNFSMGMLRPAPGRQVRPVYNWGHWATGTGAWVAAIATILLGFAMPQARVHPSAKYVLVGFVGVHLLLQVFLEWLSCNKDVTPLDRPDKPKPVSFQMTTMDSMAGRSQGTFDLGRQPTSDIGRIKAFVLSAYIFILFLLVLTLLIMINWNP